MIAEMRHTLRRLRGQIIGWSIGIGLYGLMMISLFDSIATIEGFDEILKFYPEELMAFFGDVAAISSPKGYLDIYYFSYMTIIIGIFVVSASASLLVGDEENGMLDLIMAHPISRSALFWGRSIGLLIAIIIILIISWLSWVIPAQGTGMDLTIIEFIRPFIPLLAQLILYGAFALFLSFILPSARLSGMIAGGLVVANFLLLGLANINDKLKSFIEYTPLHYYQGGEAIDGINWEWFAGLLAISIFFALLAWWQFLRRDIRVGGEGGWRLPTIPLVSRRKSEA
jgi:ABC-2 type transport system permease protein